MAVPTATSGAQRATPARPWTSTTLAPLVEELVAMSIWARAAFVLVVVVMHLAVVLLVCGIVAVEHGVLVVRVVFVLVVVHGLTSVRLGFELNITIYR